MSRSPDTPPPAGPAPERADEIESLAARIEAIGPYADCPPAAAALRDYAQLLRDTRPRFTGGARSQEDGELVGRRLTVTEVQVLLAGEQVAQMAEAALDALIEEAVAERCAPLVAALREIEALAGEPWRNPIRRFGQIARDALCAHRDVTPPRREGEGHAGHEMADRAAAQTTSRSALPGGGQRAPHDRCAPLVEFAEDMVDLIQGSPDLNLQAERMLKWARAALRAHRERTGDGDA